MPVSKEFAESNRVQTERMRQLVARLDDAGYALRLPNGWTVAGAFGHMAFWDRQRLCIMRAWADGLVDNPPGQTIAHGDVVQFIPFSSLMT